MENKILNEKAGISDELLEDVSGGRSTGVVGERLCAVCKKSVANISMVSYRGQLICKDCMAKFSEK